MKKITTLLLLGANAVNLLCGMYQEGFDTPEEIKFKGNSSDYRAQNKLLKFPYLFYYNGDNSLIFGSTDIRKLSHDKLPQSVNNALKTANIAQSNVTAYRATVVDLHFNVCNYFTHCWAINDMTKTMPTITVRNGIFDSKNIVTAGGKEPIGIGTLASNTVHFHDNKLSPDNAKFRIANPKEDAEGWFVSIYGSKAIVVHWLFLRSENANKSLKMQMEQAIKNSLNDKPVDNFSDEIFTPFDKDVDIKKAIEESKTEANKKQEQEDSNLEEAIKRSLEYTKRGDPMDEDVDLAKAIEESEKEEKELEKRLILNNLELLAKFHKNNQKKAAIDKLNSSISAFYNDTLFELICQFRAHVWGNKFKSRKEIMNTKQEEIINTFNAELNEGQVKFSDDLFDRVKKPNITNCQLISYFLQEVKKVTTDEYPQKDTFYKAIKGFLEELSRLDNRTKSLQK